MPNYPGHSFPLSLKLSLTNKHNKTRTTHQSPHYCPSSTKNTHNKHYFPPMVSYLESELAATMRIRLTVQFLCSRDDVHKCSGRAKNPGLQHPGNLKYPLAPRELPQYPEGNLPLEDALAFEEDGIMPCGKGGCVVDQVTFDALFRVWLRCYKGRCTSCLMQAVRLEMTYDPEYEEWFCTNTEPSLRLREKHADILLKEFQSQQRVIFEEYLRFPLLVRHNSSLSQISISLLTNSSHATMVQAPVPFIRMVSFTE